MNAAPEISSNKHTELKRYFYVMPTLFIGTLISKMSISCYSLEHVHPNNSNLSDTTFDSVVVI